MRLVLLVMIALALPGCLGPFGPPDTFDDMWQRLDSVAVPNDFILIGKEQLGSRESFMAIPEPSVTNRYSVPLDERDLCERLRQVLADGGRPVATKRYGKACGHFTTLSAGWKAKLVNVWTYDLAAYATAATAPGAPVTNLTSSECAEIRKQHEQARGPNDYFRGVPECWLEPGHALVTIYVEGKQGWVPLSVLRSTPPPLPAN